MHTPVNAYGTQNSSGLSQVAYLYATPQPAIHMGIQMQESITPYGIPRMLSQMTPDQMQHAPQLEAAEVAYRGTVPSLLDFAGAPKPVATDDITLPLPPGLQQHSEGVFFIDNKGHRTSPRRAERMVKDRSVSQGAKESKASKTVKPVSDKPKGKGSRSGKNARKAGNSDEEIAILSDNEKKAAQIVVPVTRRRWTEAEKEVIVDFIVKPENWARVTLNLKDLCVKVCQTIFHIRMSFKHVFQLSQTHFEGQRSVEQIRQCWMGIWTTYKAVIRKQKHTGGGDGDEALFPVDFDDSSVIALDGELEDDEGDEDVDTKKKTGAEDAKKPRRQPSSKVIDEFAKSKMFKLIEAV